MSWGWVQVTAKLLHCLMQVSAAKQQKQTAGRLKALEAEAAAAAQQASAADKRAKDLQQQLEAAQDAVKVWGRGWDRGPL